MPRSQGWRSDAHASRSNDSTSPSPLSLSHSSATVQWQGVVSWVAETTRFEGRATTPSPSGPPTPPRLATRYLPSLQAYLLRYLHHPNIIRIYQIFRNEPDYYYMVVTPLPGGELFDHLVRKVRTGSLTHSNAPGPTSGQSRAHNEELRDSYAPARYSLTRRRRRTRGEGSVLCWPAGTIGVRPFRFEHPAPFVSCKEVVERCFASVR